MGDSTRNLMAYYYGFSPSGADTVDAVLEAVARAGKGCHNTEDWNEFGYPDKIQDAANVAAAEAITLSSRVAALEKALRPLAAIADASHFLPKIQITVADAIEAKKVLEAE